MALRSAYGLGALLQGALLQIKNSLGNARIQILSKTGGIQEIYFADLSSEGDFFDISSPGNGTLELYSKVPPGGSWVKIGIIGGGRVVTEVDDDHTLVVTAGATSDIDGTVLFYGTTLTAVRTVTLTAAGAFEGQIWRIVRLAAADGGDGLDVGGLKTLALGEWCEVVFDGTAWQLVAFGAL